MLNRHLYRVLAWSVISFLALSAVHCYFDNEHSFFGQFDRDVTSVILGVIAYVLGYIVGHTPPRIKQTGTMGACILLFFVVINWHHTIFGETNGWTTQSQALEIFVVACGAIVLALTAPKAVHNDSQGSTSKQEGPTT